MHSQTRPEVIDRRKLLGGALRGVSGLALASLLAEEGRLVAADEPELSSPSGVAASSSSSTQEQLLNNPSQTERKLHHPPTAKHCIFFFMWGGPSQLDMFDHKPVLNKLHGQPIPDEIAKTASFAFAQKDSARLLGSPFRFSHCGQSGMMFSELIPHLAGCADQISLIRATHTDSFNHRPGQILMNTGFSRVGRPSLGSWLHYGLGSPNHDLPGYIAMQSGSEADGGSSNWSSGFLPAIHQGTPLRRSGPPILNLENPPELSPQAHRRSMDAIHRLNDIRRRELAEDDIAARIENYELAFRMQTAGPELFDLSQETQATLTAYGVDRADEDDQSFARNCLLARRMVERGVRFVHVIFGSWDSHFYLDKQHRSMCRTVDQPIAALLKDLKARGLLDSTLVVWATEFGRTPIGENRNNDPDVTGRDHHPTAFTTWMAGGGVKAGNIVGETDELGWNSVADAVHVNDFHATILHLFGFDHRRLVYRFQGRDYRLTDVGGNVVSKLLT